MRIDINPCSVPNQTVVSDHQSYIELLDDRLVVGYGGVYREKDESTEMETDRKRKYEYVVRRECVVGVLFTRSFHNGTDAVNWVVEIMATGVQETHILIKTYPEAKKVKDEIIEWIFSK